MLRPRRAGSGPVLIGYWASEQADWWPTPAQFIDEDWNADEREIVADYLLRGFVSRTYMGYSQCRICGVDNGALELSDGDYVWPEGFAHYVLEHRIRPPAPFVDHVLAVIDDLGDGRYDESWWRSFGDPSQSSH
jgi:hypothetical protein